MGFAALNLEQKTSIDSLTVMTELMRLMQRSSISRVTEPRRRLTRPVRQPISSPPPWLQQIQKSPNYWKRTSCPHWLASLSAKEARVLSVMRSRNIRRNKTTTPINSRTLLPVVRKRPSGESPRKVRDNRSSPEKDGTTERADYTS